MQFMEIASIILYPGMLLLPFAAYSIASWAWQRHKFLFYSATYFPIAMFAAMRGNVGTDTENYRDAFDFFTLTDFNLLTVDPIFMALFGLAKALGLGFNGFAFIHAALCLLFYSYGASRVDREIPVFGLLLMPVLFVDATFNGLRYGLAFGIATVALHYFVNSTSRLRLAYLLPPVAAHSSLSVLLFLAPGLIIAAAPLLLLLNIQDLLYFSYFAGKSESYSEFARPGIFSGLMPVFQFSMLLWITKINQVKFKLGINIQSLALVVFFGGIAASSVSYAGLRILQLAVFIMTVFAAQHVQPEKRRTTTALVVTAGLLSVANFLRQIFFVGVEGGVVFYPYDFFNPF